jgi:murein DD-endopeptidase MepM/ murein hydrolase activator NlpD
MLLLPVLLLIAGAASGDTMEEIDLRIKAEQSRLATIEKQIDYHKKQISISQQKEQRILEELAKLTEEINRSHQRISLLELQNEKTQLRLEELSREIAVTESRLGAIRGLLRERVVALYKYGGVAEMEMLLACDNLYAAMEASYLLNRMTQMDKELFREAAERKRLLDASREETEARKRELSERLLRLKDAARDLQKNIKNRNGYLESLRQQRQDHRSTAAALERMQAQQEKELSELLKKKQRLAEEKRRVEEQKPENALPPLTKPGRLAWPIRGQITSSFGMRVHPVFKTKLQHTGIDIDGNMGDSVKAAGVGEVIFAGVLRGYGQIIILDHGGGLSTVYAHLSRILVREGQRVQTGHVIGKVGSTGTSTGPHLHFEVREKGNARNPTNYLGS